MRSINIFRTRKKEYTSIDVQKNREKASIEGETVAKEKRVWDMEIELNVRQRTIFSRVQRYIVFPETPKQIAKFLSFYLFDSLSIHYRILILTEDTPYRGGTPSSLSISIRILSAGEKKTDRELNPCLAVALRRRSRHAMAFLSSLRRTFRALSR